MSIFEEYTALSIEASVNVNIYWSFCILYIVHYLYVD